MKKKPKFTKAQFDTVEKLCAKHPASMHFTRKINGEMRLFLFADKGEELYWIAPSGNITGSSTSHGNPCVVIPFTQAEIQEAKELLRILDKLGAEGTWILNKLTQSDYHFPI